jgi:hypothetical protein
MNGLAQRRGMDIDSAARGDKLGGRLMAEQTVPVPRGIRSEMATVAGLLSKSWVYKMPPFQRPYSWTDEEVDCLVEDLRVATAFSYPYYFLGHIVFNAGDGDVFIIDGQQRMVTLTILMAYLRDHTQDKALSGELQRLIMMKARDGARIILRPTDRDFFRSHVQYPGQIEALLQRKDLEIKPQMLIQRAAANIAAALDPITEDERDALARFITRKVTFNLIETEDLDGASALFRVINYRGLRPSDSTIIKTELLEKAKFSHDEANEIADRWDNMEDQFGDKGIAELWSTIEVIVSGQAPREKNNPRSFRSKVIEHVDAQKFLREDLWRYVYALRDIEDCAVDAGAASEEVNRRIACMKLYKDRSWLAPAVAMVADHSGNPELLRRFFLGLDRLAFACVMTVIRNQGRFERFARVVRARGQEKDLFGRDGALMLTTGQTNALIGKLNDPINTDDNRGRLIALRLNAALPGGTTLSLSDNATLEHILPKSDTDYWRGKFANDKRRKEYTYLIGNFALLTQKQNDDASNKSWEEKRRIYFKTRGAPIQALTADVEHYQDWNEDSLRQRHVFLVGVLCNDLELV